MIIELPKLLKLPYKKYAIMDNNDNYPAVAKYKVKDKKSQTILNIQ